jgi:hypothetical protein
VGTLARGDTDNRGEHTTLADKARTLIAGSDSSRT